MRAHTTMTTVVDFHHKEPDMLAAINRVPHGAELFLADPFRFLGEHGFAVSPALRDELVSRAPALAKVPTHLYDGIAARGASLLGKPTGDITWHISSLGVQP